MSDLISKVLNDPWVVTLITWVVRLILLCLLAGLVHLIYRLTVSPIVRFPYPPKEPETGVRGWFRGLRERLGSVKLKPPWAEIELLSKIEEKREIRSVLEEKDARIKKLEGELEKHRNLITEMKEKLAEKGGVS